MKFSKIKSKLSSVHLPKSIDLKKIRIFFTCYRSGLNGTLKEYTIVTLLYLLITVLLTEFVAFHITHQIFATPGDATSGFLWLNFADRSFDPLISETGLANYPYGENAGGWTLISYFSYWLPMRALSYFLGATAALNIVMIGGYVSAALAMYWLLKRITGNKLLAFFGGYAVAFVPYAMSKSSGHISYIFSGIFSLIIGVFLSFWQRPTLKKALTLASLLGIAFYTDGYFILIAITLAISLLLSGCVYLMIFWNGWGALLKRIKYTTIALVAFFVLISPLILVQLVHGPKVKEQLGQVRSDIGNEMRGYSSNITDLILPPSENVFLATNSRLQGLHAYNNMRSNGSENNNFISPIFYIFCVIAVTMILIRLIIPKYSSINRMSKTTLQSIIMVALISSTASVLCLLLMFSPEVSVAGITIPLPGRILIDNNIVFWRVMSRLFVLLNVSVVSLGVVGIWLATTAFKKNNVTLNKKWSIIVVGLSVVITFMLYFSSFPSRPFDLKSDVHKTYYWLKNQEDIKSVAEIPVVDPLDGHASDFVTAQIVHRKKIMNQREASTIRLNNSLGDLNNDELINMIQARGIDAVLYRSLGKCPELHWGYVVYTEKIDYYERDKGTTNRMLCTYKVIKQKADPVFVRFDDGFTPSANAPNPSNIVFHEGAQGKMVLTYADLKTKYKGRVKLIMKIHNNGGLGNGWQLSTTDGHILAKGSLTKKNEGGLYSEVDYTGEIQQPIILKITGSESTIPLGQVYLSDVIATSL